ncbi:MAG: penicillin-binding protein 2 [Rhodospirillales bacterium]|nr:penicillin-binding protein 2 [Rhodospirillales bacterium]MBO6787167.1 penicillin-binding protein 2 [Rhodospirillales bacterium]
MNRDPDRQKIFTRRAAMLAGGKAVLLTALAGRLYYLQVVEADRYATLADENRINLRLLAPPRGRIIDRFGRPLAENQQNYRLQLVPEDVKGSEIQEVLDHVQKIVTLTEGDKRRIIREVRRNRAFVPVTLKENLSWSEVARIEINAPDLPGLMIDVGRSRRYPFGPEAAHVLGYVASVSENDLDDDPLLKLPGFRVGRAGIEKVHDLDLRGTGGSSEVEVNAFGRMIRELSRREGQPGAEVMLTLDMGLQKYIAERLGTESASVVVMDVRNGDVLAMVSNPSYDSNDFNRGLSTGEWQELVNNERAPLINKSIAGVYPPGSTFKMMVLLAALEKGVISPDHKIHCSGEYELGDAKFHCWKRHGHGFVDALEAVTESCDVYFYEIAKRTGIDRIAATARKFGLDLPTGIDLPGEQGGLIPTRDWKRATRDEPWHQGETVIAGIGQGFVLLTPLQMALMTARIANGGRAVTPHLTRAIGGVPADRRAPDAAPSLNIPPGHLELVMEAMNRVVNHPTGTARRSNTGIEDFPMAGKTGTVQVRRISKAEREQGVRKNEELPWKYRDHALFVGFAPVENPRYAVSVVVEHGGGGSTTAAPIAKDVLVEAYNRGSAGPGVAIAGAQPQPRKQDAATETAEKPAELATRSDGGT